VIKPELTTVQRLRRKGQRLGVSGVQSSETQIRNLIVIGTSAGGHGALIEVVRGLSADIPAAIVIMYHSPATNPFKLEDWLRRYTSLPVLHMRAKEKLRNGVIFIAPPGRAVSVEPGLLLVDSQHRDTPHRNIIDCLFASAAKAYDSRVIGVILTGLLNDGTVGLKQVYQAGGLTIVQNPEEAEYRDMPANAMKEVPVAFCLNVAEIGPTLDLLARRKARLETGVALSIRLLKERVALLVRLIEQSKQNVDTHQFLSQELFELEHDLQLIQKLLQDVLKPCNFGGHHLQTSRTSV